MAQAKSAWYKDDDQRLKSGEEEDNDDDVAVENARAWDDQKDDNPRGVGNDIELMDNDTWQVKSGLTHLWQGSLERELKEMHSTTEADFFDEQVNDVASLQGDSNFDEIDSMRIRGNLFYKLDKNSKEFEEYSFDFHRKKCSKKNDNPKEIKKKGKPKS